MIRQLAVAAALIAIVLASPAAAADRMWIGFTDDPSLRFADDRMAELSRVAASGATIVRTIVRWNTIAAWPADASDPFDPAYSFQDLDEFVRNAQARGLEVVMALWGTPGWANGDQLPQMAPTDMNDFRAFAQAVATRYSGRLPGYPFVASPGSGTSRTWPPSCGRSSGRRRDRQPRDLRTAGNREVRGIRPGIRKPRSPSERPRPTAVTAKSPASPTRSRRARSCS